MLPTEPKKRKEYPIVSGCLDYFPDALVAVAGVSFVGNEQHNPGQPLHWDRSKSTDEADALGRHLLQRGTLDSDGVRHSAKVAWRALALLQKEIEAERNVPMSEQGGTGRPKLFMIHNSKTGSFRSVRAEPGEVIDMDANEFCVMSEDV